MAYKKKSAKSPNNSGVVNSFSNSKTRFSKPMLAVVMLVFVATGTFFVWRSFAAPSTVFYAPDLARSKSVNYVDRTETRQSKKNSQVIQLANTTDVTAKATYAKNIAAGNYKACLYGVSQSNNPSGTFTATDTVVRGSSYYYATNTEYKSLTCMQIYHDNSSLLSFEVTVNRSQSSLRISSIVLTPNNGTSTPPNISISPALSGVSSSANFIFGIWEDSLKTPVNAVQANLTYDATKFDFVSIDTTKSAFNIQAESRGGSGKIFIARGNTGGGLTGKQLVGYVTLKPKVSSGTSIISFASGTQVAGANTNADVLQQKTNAGVSFSPL